MAGKTFTQEWTDKERAELTSNPQDFKMFKDMMAGLQASGNQYALEAVLKKFE